MRALRLAISLVVATASAVSMGNGPALADPLTNPPAGQYHNVSHEAAFNFFDQSTGNSVSIDVTDTASTSAPVGTAPSTTESTVLNLQIFSGGIGQQGCYDIAPTDFTFGGGSSALHTMITASTTSCTQPFQIPPTPPFSVDATWTGNAPVTSSQSATTFSCGGYGLETASALTLQGASATATVSPLLPTAMTAPQDQLLRSEDDRDHAHGVLPSNCEPFGAIAGGAGPPPAGDYQSSSTSTDFNTTTSSGLFVDVNVMESTQTSSPKGGQPTTTNEFQLGIDTFGNGTFANGCFQLTPADFTSNGVLSATLSLTIDSSTPMCFPGGQTSLPLPLTINLTWTGSGPAATTRTVGTFDCLSYRNEETTLNLTNNANVTATLNPLLPGVISGPGTLATSSGGSHAEGAQQPACHL